MKYAKQKSKRSITTYSKRVISAITLVWFFGALFGAVILSIQLFKSPESVSLGDYLMYIGAPMTGGILGYMLKSAAENKIKIKKGVKTPDESEDEENA